MLPHVDVKALIKINGFSKDDLRPSKSITPELEERRLKKDIKEANRYLNTFLKNLPGDISSSIEELTYIRDYKLSDKRPDYCDESNYEKFVRYRPELPLYPRGTDKVTKDTTDEEIKEIVERSAKSDENYWRGRVTTAESKLKRFQASGPTYMLLWVCPDPDVVVKIDSNLCSGSNAQTNAPISVQELYKYLEEGRKIDISLRCNNDRSSFIATNFEATLN